MTAARSAGMGGTQPATLRHSDQRHICPTPHAPSATPAHVVLTGPANVLTNIRNRAHQRGVESVAYIEEMFATGHDKANRAVFAQHGADETNTVGIALRADKKIVDKITKGAKMHG